MVKFKNSTLGQLGWTEKDYIETTCAMGYLKMKNNMRMTVQEMKIIIEYGDDYQMEKYEDQKIYQMLKGPYNA